MASTQYRRRLRSRIIIFFALFGFALAALFALSAVYLRGYLENKLIGDTLEQNLQGYADAFYRDPSTPVIIGRAVSGAQPGAGESMRVVRLADLDPAEVDMRCLLIIGSSQTRVVASTGRVFTPRRYPDPS